MVRHRKPGVRAVGELGRLRNRTCWHPKEWRAAALLWGAAAIPERDWSGYRGPGEDRRMVATDLPTSHADGRLVSFIESFDAPTAFGDDLTPVHARLRAHATAGRGLPRDLGLLRAGLWVEHQSEEPDVLFVDDLLRSMSWLFPLGAERLRPVQQPSP